MKKSKFMRVAAILMAAVLLTTCAISGTFAKYTTTVEGTAVTARVAKWGFGATSSITINNLFSATYVNESNSELTSVDSANHTDKVIAPGTTGSASFAFLASGGTPEVAYSITVDTTGSSIDDAIDNNANIQWKLDSGSWGSWDDLLTAIAGLSVARIEANTAPNAASGAAGTTHTVSWQWIFSDSAAHDTADTAMGDTAATATADDVTLQINFTATQLD